MFLKPVDKTILFETAKAKFFDEYIRTVNEITDSAKIDYLVVSHTEPDHSGSIESFLSLIRELKIICTVAGCRLFEGDR